MRASEVYPDHPGYIKAADLAGKTPRVTIASVGVHQFDEAQKLTLAFRESDRGMVVNKTNSKILQNAFGDETDQWVGKVIMLHTVQTNLGPGIGVVVPSDNGQTSQLQTPELRQQQANPNLDVPPGEDIPF